MKPTRHKTTCQEVIEFLSDYTTEIMSWRVRITVRAHLRKCLGCSAYESQLVEILRACRNLGSEALSDAQLRPLLEAFAAQNFGHPDMDNEQYEGENMSEYKVTKSDKEWHQILTPDRFAVLRQGATEAPFSGELVNVEGEGIFTCAGCGTELFDTSEKFYSSCGWPSFDAHLGPVAERSDTSFGMRRTEVMCSTCGGHLGHVFDDGPTETGLRYCINSLSLEFSPEPTNEEGGAP